MTDVAVLNELRAVLERAGVDPADLAAPAPLAIPATGRIPDVVDGTVIESAWGNAIRDRSTTPYATANDANAGTQPPEGALSYVIDTGRLFVKTGGSWILVGGALTSTGLVVGSAVGSTVTGIAASSVVCTAAIPSAPFKRAVHVTAVLRIDNETAAAGVMGCRLEAGSTWTQALAQYPATAAYLNSFAVSYATTIAGGSGLSINLVAFRQSGTCTGKAWNDGTINRINWICTPCP